MGQDAHGWPQRRVEDEGHETEPNGRAGAAHRHHKHEGDVVSSIEDDAATADQLAATDHPATVADARGAARAHAAHAKAGDQPPLAAAHAHAAHGQTVDQAPGARHGHAGHVQAAPTRRAPHAHDRHAGHRPQMFRDRFWLAFLLTIPVVLYSHEVQEWLGYTAPAFPGSTWIPPVLGTAVFLYGGLVFVRGAAGELRDRQPAMMTLISLAITVAFVASTAATLGVFEVEVWWELSTLITIMLLGHWLEMRAIAQARGALDALAALLPDEAERLTDGRLETVPLSSLRVGDIVLVRPGGRVPADGSVVEGRADVDESMITGESRRVG